MVSRPQNRPRRHVGPRTSGHLVQPEGRPAHAQWGPTVGPPGPQGEKNIFSKVVPRPLGMLKQVYLGSFEPVATGFGSWRLPKCLENGPFWDQKWVKNGSKPRFSKSDPGPFGMLKQVFLARFEPALTEFSPFHHMYAPLCALRTYLRAVWWGHLELGDRSVTALSARIQRATAYQEYIQPQTFEFSARPPVLSPPDNSKNEQRPYSGLP